MVSLKNSLYLLLAIIIGSLWGHSLSIVPLASIVLIPILWAKVDNRWLAGLVPCLYVLFATRGLIDGSAVYFQRGVLFGTSLWLLAAIPHYLAGVLAWFKSPQKRAYLGIPLLCLLWIIPPVMFVGWAHPLLAAGLWFPRLSFLSLVLCLLLIIYLAICRSLLLYIAMVSLVSIQAVIRYQSPTINQSHGWIAHDTQFINNPKTLLAHLQRQWALLSDINSNGIHVFPEAIADKWDGFLASQWLATLPNNTTALVGAFLHQDNNWQNVIVSIDKQTAKVIYRQRLPMTAGMFNPFSTNNFSLNLFGKPTATVNHQRVGFAICFEHVVLLPMLQTTWEKPNIIVAPANVWWSPKSLQLAQRQSLRLWQQWLGKPIIEAINGENHD